ncbi:MAG: polysaccharide deacetylase family protein [Leptospirales bacterium]
MERSRALVLMYHQIVADDCPDDWVPSPLADPRYGVRLSTFRRQMEAVRESRIPVCSFSDWIADPGRLEREDQLSLIITFDDGYSSDRDLAAPVLKSLGIPATFFISTGFMGKSGMMSWESVESLARNPHFSVGSHGVSHRFLSSMTPEECRKELEDSFRQIGGLYRRAGRCNEEPIDLSAPGGRTSPEVASLAGRAGFRALMTSAPGVFGPRGDLYSVPRLPVMAHHSEGNLLRLLNPESLAFLMNRWLRSGKQLAGALRDRAKSFRSEVLV